MTALTILLLAAGAIAASWNGDRGRPSECLELAGGSLLATGLLLLGISLRIMMSGKI